MGETDSWSGTLRSRRLRAGQCDLGEGDLASRSASFSKLLLATTSPGLIPSTAVSPLSVIPDFTVAHAPPCCPGSGKRNRCAVVLDGGGRDMTWFSSVFTSRRVLTNWLGNRDPCAVVELRAQLDRSGDGVDLVVDGDELACCRAASAACGRRRRRSAAACRASAAAPAAELSSASVKITVMGWICVTTTRVVVELAVTRLPGSTSRKSDAPVNGRR